MKIYTVTPGQNFITVSDGRTITFDQPIAWGKMCGMGGAIIASTIIADVIGDPVRAGRYAQRFKFRTIENWSKDTGNGITEDEVKAVIADIVAVEKETRPFVEKMMRERPQFVSDRPDAGQEYTSNPEIKPNEIKEKENPE